jgi:hypothetical protein
MAHLIIPDNEFCSFGAYLKELEIFLYKDWMARTHRKLTDKTTGLDIKIS